MTVARGMTKRERLVNKEVIGILFQESKVIVYILELARNSRDRCKKDFQSRQDFRSKALSFFPD